jgi:hypothetical protein
MSAQLSARKGEQISREKWGNYPMRAADLPATLETLAGVCPPDARKGRPMVNLSGIARLGILAVGLGIGAAWAHTPVAAADSSSDWLSSIDGLLSGALPAADPSGLNLAISFDGMSLLSEGTAKATTASGEYGLAIAYGDGASATAEGGTGNYALADGTNAEAAAGGAAGSTGNNFDSSIDIGNNGDVVADQDYNGAYAGAGSLLGGEGGTGGGSYNTAIDIGNNASGTLEDGAHAGAGGLEGLGDDGNHNFAIDIGNNSNGTGQGAIAVGGDYNSGSYQGNIDVADGSNGHFAYAGFGDGNIANVVGDNGYAASGGGFDPAVVGNDNIATVFDPFGTLGSTAVAGEGLDVAGNFDLAAVFGDGFDTFPGATGGNFLVEILPNLF